MDAETVRSALKMEDERSLAWLSDLEKLGSPPEPVRLPQGDEARELLRRLGVPELDVEEIVAATPGPDRDPALWWLLERTHHAIIRNMGDCRVKRRGAPNLPSGTGAAGRYFHVYVFLATVPAVRGFHESRGIPEKVTWETLAQLGDSVATYRRKHGEGGMNTQWWTAYFLSGIVYQLGRLQFSLAVGRDGTPELGLHIPEAGGPLKGTIFYDSLCLARPFFDRHFPEHGADVLTGTSWLLDPQLEEYLSEESHIIRFRRAWTRIEGDPEPGDDAILEFVFHYNGEPLDELPQRTSLERAVVAHLKAGRHWYEYAGHLPLP
ncbi:acyltransferase [Amycolatopsis sp. WAC 01376]|uniref:acyltransferase domain-containing protein n=1 Tax=Amycolatopsis sp. WAC 01376 TaxID=2203195 RepID=UPI000F7A62DA|nr:acyltransferase domain-containing protein [Amycolatopsis sp. WAC 01376]RSM55259.1 acyltransferase [Amycolatopsis sp. WAC 01376]